MKTRTKEIWTIIGLCAAGVGLIVGVAGCMTYLDGMSRTETVKRKVPDLSKYTEVCQALLNHHLKRNSERVVECRGAAQKRVDLFNSAVAKLSVEERQVLSKPLAPDHACPRVLEQTWPEHNTRACELFLAKLEKGGLL